MALVRTGDFDCWYFDDYLGMPWVTPEVIVLQHGNTRNSEFWRSWVPDLAREYRVIRRDMRAHGRSSAGADDHEWTLDSISGDVIAFLDALGLERVHYVGEALGGITGIVLGARHSDRLETLTLAQTPIRMTRALTDSLRGADPWAWPLRDARAWAGQYTSVQESTDSSNKDSDDRLVQWAREQFYATDHEARARLFATLDWDLEPYLSRIPIPTLLLAPTESPVTPLPDQLLMHATIPNAEIEIFEGLSQDVYLAERERCTSRVLQFIGDNRVRA